MEILHIEESDRIEICNVLDEIFQEFYDDRKLKLEINLYKSIIEFYDLYKFIEYDRKMVIDGKIVGIYLLDDCDYIDSEWLKGNYESYKNKKGICGSIMGIIPEYRNKGYGKLLVEYSKSIKGFDYIWGGNYKKLNTSNFWLKHRSFIGENEDNIYTIMDLNNK